MMPEWMDPETLGQLEAHAAYVALIAGAIAVGISGLLLAALEAWGKRQDRRDQEQADSDARAAQHAAQLEAGIQAGWHDASPAGRRRDR
jgi:hypothetical protein